MPKKLPAADQARVPWESAFARSLIQRREARGLSQTQLARHATDAGLKMHQTTVARIENGSRSVNLNEALTLAKVLDANPLSMAEYVADTEAPVQVADLAVERAQDVARSVFTTTHTAWNRLDEAIGDAHQWANRALADVAIRAGMVDRTAKNWTVVDLEINETDDKSLASDAHRVERHRQTLDVLQAMSSTLESFLSDHSDDNMRPVVEPADRES